MLCYRCGSHVPDSATACGNCGQSFASGNLRKTSGTFSRKRPAGLSLEGAPFKPGDVLANRYTIKDVLGIGPLGHVLRAFDQEIDVEVALKVISPRLLQTPEERRAFSQQIRLARKLTHGNVVHVYEDGEEADRPYFTMQCLDGLSLRRIIELRREKNQFFSLREIEPIFAQLAQALDAIHRVSPHGNVKPENVIVLPDLLKLSDFGLARALPCQPFVAAQKARNAHRYLSPEYCGGHDLDRRSDIYALGVMLGEMLAGVFPEKGETPELRTSNPDLPAGVESLYRRAVNETPKSRQASAGEFFGELARLAADWDNAPPARRPTPRPESLTPPPTPATDLVIVKPEPPAAKPTPASELVAKPAPKPAAKPSPSPEPPARPAEAPARPPPLPDDAKTPVASEVPALAAAEARAASLTPPPPPPSAPPVAAAPAPRAPIGVARPLSETRPPERSKGSSIPRPAIALMLVGVFAGVGAGGFAYLRFVKGPSAPAIHVDAKKTAPKAPSAPKPAVEPIQTAAEPLAVPSPVAIAPDAGVPVAAAEPASQAKKEAPVVKAPPAPVAPEKPAPVAEKRREPEREPELKARPQQAAAREKAGGKHEIKQALDKAFADAEQLEEASARTGRAPACPAGMRLIPAGSFRMGTARDDPLMGFDERVLSTVEVDAYCIDLYEYPNKPGTPPTTGVSYAAAERSCKAQGKRLCTEEEWERACKGPGNLRFPYGNAFDPDACNVKGADDEERRVVRAGAFNRCYSAFGMADMSGNVAEWTASHYSDDVADRTVKGGASDRPDYDVRCASRKNASPGSSSDKLGFRCCSDGS